MLRLVVVAGRAGVPEVEQHIDLIVGDAGSDLLFPALIAVEKPLDLKAGGFGNILCSHAGSAEVMFA